MTIIKTCTAWLGLVLFFASLGTATVSAADPAFVNSLHMHFVRIPAGSFQMGCREAAGAVAANPAYGDKAGKVGWYRREHPLHRVVLTRPFLFQTTEVTVGQFRVFAAETGYRTEAEREGWGWAYSPDRREWVRQAGVHWQAPGFAQADDHPVTYVSWNDAQAFVQWLNQKEETARYRLPTEAEWEYACRAGSQTPFYWGGRPDGRYANFADAAYARAHPGDEYVNRSHDDGRAYTAPVGSYRPNAFGLFDMSGNLNEWCQDWYDEYTPGEAIDPSGPARGKHRVLRGGSWYGIAGGMRSANRGRNTPGYSFSRTGFRLAWTY